MSLEAKLSELNDSVVALTETIQKLQLGDTAAPDKPAKADKPAPTKKKTTAKKAAKPEPVEDEPVDEDSEAYTLEDAQKAVIAYSKANGADRGYAKLRLTASNVGVDPDSFEEFKVSCIPAAHFGAVVKAFTAEEEAA